MTRRSALYVGAVSHRRHRPRANAFRYGLYWTLLDVDELADLDREVRGFGYRRAAVTSFHDTDHFGSADVPVRVKLARWLAGQGIELPSGRLEVLTSLRVLGYVFNPVSWWFCHDADGALALVVAEVNNTFGDRYCYRFDLTAQRNGTFTANAPKAFHVSPFLPIDGHRYEVTFLPPGERTLVQMRVQEPTSDGYVPVLDATQDGRRVPLTSATLARTLVRFPLVTLRTMYLIHRQALRLWRLRTPFFRRPEAPDQGLDRVGSARPPVSAGPVPPRAVAEPVPTPAAPVPTPQEIAS